jgi:[ribosomal protein S18]-alanine N-acetyltransferase
MSAEPLHRAPSPPDAETLDVTVGPLRRRHLRAVLHIEQQVHPRPWSLGLFMSELGYRGSRAYLAAKVNSEIVGYGGLMVVADDAHITNVAVDPAWQRHKVGTRLLLALARAGIERGAENLTLEVRVGNRAAQGLYRTFGFVPAGIRKGYYAETGEDALVMWANDVHVPAYADRLAGIAASVPGTTTLEELPR